ncbi:uncharacterized protein [Rutidosis leptorrhynchoides]|uniref:uncharacterized protein n=1 Tax=Rutidosis leptorrhynchoides TaxID=125765 RepID=UPI003A99E28A
MKSIGDGRTTSFWNDVWCGSDCFKNMFPRLYMLDRNKDAMVRDRVTAAYSCLAGSVTAANVHDSSSGSVPVAGFSPYSNAVRPQSTAADSVLFLWEWSHVPTGRTTTELQEITNLVRSISFDFNAKESWKWALANNGVFTVKQLSSLHDKQILGSNNNSAQCTLRNNLVPKKVEIFVWRALKKRIPVRIELDKRGIDLHSVRCPSCDDGLETVEHFFINCRHALDVWIRVCNWWKLVYCSPSNIGDISHGKSPNVMTTLGQKIWQAVEWVCGFYLWKNRNSLVFQNRSWSAPMLLSEIQVKSFEWISCRLKGKNIE